jgi:hypothetical protein
VRRPGRQRSDDGVVGADGDDDPGRIRDRRIEQLDLDTDDRMDPDRLGSRHEPDGAIQPGVVRDGERAETDLGGSLDEVVRRGRAVEEREVGVAVELGVGDLCHDSGPRSGGCLGTIHSRTSVLECAHRSPASTPDEIPIGFRIPGETTSATRRLTGMQHLPPTRQVAISAVRTALLVAVAMLLILGLLPAVLAVQAASM